MPQFSGRYVAVVGITVLIAGASACTTVQTESENYGTRIAKPDRIIVNDFAYSPDQVRLDSGLSAKVMEAASGESRSEQELDTGREVSIALSNELVKEIRAMGLPAERGSFPVDVPDSVALVRGQFLSINEGNRTERVVIGLGAGRTDVQAQVQLYAVKGSERKLLESLEVDAKSSRAPGMAETMGMGAATGNLAAAAVVGAGGHAAGEEFGANVEDDASRAAKAIAGELKKVFAREGWIEASPAE